MPFTPLHLGPGAVFKAVGGRHFSFMAFAGAQVLMDIEPLIGIIEHKPVLHGYSHTIAGALVIGTLAGLIARPIGGFVLKLLRREQALTWRASFSGAFVGTFSHIGLDALMHADMNPWWPFTVDNPWLGLISVAQLNLLCLGLGAIGALTLAGMAIFRGTRNRGASPPPTAPSS